MYCILFAVLFCGFPLLITGVSLGVPLTILIVLVVGIAILAVFGLPAAIVYWIVVALLNKFKKKPELTSMHTEESKEIKMRRI